MAQELTLKDLDFNGLKESIRLFAKLMGHINNIKATIVDGEVKDKMGWPIFTT